MNGRKRLRLNGEVTEFLLARVAPRGDQSTDGLFRKSIRERVDLAFENVSARSKRRDKLLYEFWGGFETLEYPYPRPRVYAPFGKFDVLIHAVHPNSYWSSAFRTELTRLEGFWDVVSIPCTRVRTGAEGGEEERQDPITVVLLLSSSSGLGRQGLLALRDFVGDSEDGALGKALCGKNVDLYLTHSSAMPVILAGSFRSFSHVDEFTSRLRSFSLVGGVASVVCLGEEALQSPCELDGESLAVSVFIKAAPGSSKLASETALRILAPITDSRHPMVLNWAYYWDFVLSFETDQIATVAGYVDEELRRIDYIADCCVVPQWSMNPQPEIKTALVEQCVGRTERVVAESELSRDEVYDLHLEFEGRLPTGRPDSRPNEQALARRYFDVATHFLWLLSDLQQLEVTWRSTKTPGLRSIALLRRRLGRSLKELNLVCEGVSLLIDDPRDSESLKRIGSFLRDYEREASRSSDWISSIRAEFNTRHQLVDSIISMEPRISQPEHTGASDAFQEAASRVLRAFCNSWDLVGCGEFQYQWDGLVTVGHKTSDWVLAAEYEILKIPFDFKTALRNRLPLLAHLAAHQILYGVSRSDGPCHDDLSKIRTEACDLAVQRLSEVRKVLADESRANDLDWMMAALDTLHDFEMRAGVGDPHIAVMGGCDEVLADVLAVLAAGESFVFSLADVAYPVDTDQSQQWADRLPSPLRTAFCHMVMRVMGQRDSDSWLPYQENDKLLKDGTPRREVFAVLISDSGLADLDRNAFLDPSINPADLLSASFAYAFLRNHGELSRRLAHWCRQYSKDYLLCALRQDGTFGLGSSSSIAERWRETALRLLQGEVVLDEDPRSIAAASVDPRIPRVGYPTQAIIHSLNLTEWPEEATEVV